MSQIFHIHIKRVCLIFFLLFSTIGCDQATKIIARDALSVSGPISYLNGGLKLIHAENPGAFLSLGASLSDEVRFLIFTLFVGLALIGFGFYLFRKDSNIVETFALSLILGGGIGNLIDRAIQGTVTDFLFINFGFFQTGIFNFADVAIMFGVFVFFGVQFIPVLKSKTYEAL